MSEPVPAAVPGLFSAAGPPDVVAASADQAWLGAMLDVERAIAAAAARLGLVSTADAQAVARACDPALHDVGHLARSHAGQATPVIALVERIRELVPPGARGAVHVAATSQDVVDTAAMLITRRTLDLVLPDVAGVGDLLADLAARHRDTRILGRTLLQHGLVTTFGATCAGRLVAVDEALAGLLVVRDQRLAVQLGGAVGTLVSAGPAGLDLVREVASELDLREPIVPWHTSRGRIAEIACAIGILAGELAAVALDIVLLCGSDIGELDVAAPGASSVMAHKRNPARPVLALAAAHRIPGLVATVLAGMPQELQRAAGHWQGEPATLTELLRLLGSLAADTRASLDALVVNADVMAAAVEAFTARTGVVPALGAAGAFVDRALAAHRAGAMSLAAKAARA